MWTLGPDPPFATICCGLGTGASGSFSTLDVGSSGAWCAGQQSTELHGDLDAAAWLSTHLLFILVHPAFSDVAHAHSCLCHPLDWEDSFHPLYFIHPYSLSPWSDPSSSHSLLAPRVQM